MNKMTLKMLKLIRKILNRMMIFLINKTMLGFMVKNLMKKIKIWKIIKMNLINKSLKNFKRSLGMLSRRNQKDKIIKNKRIPKMKAKIPMITLKTILIILDRYNWIIKNFSNRLKKLNLTIKLIDFRVKSLAKRTGSWKVKSMLNKDQLIVF